MLHLAFEMIKKKTFFFCVIFFLFFSLPPLPPPQFFLYVGLDWVMLVASLSFNLEYSPFVQASCYISCENGKEDGGGKEQEGVMRLHRLIRNWKFGWQLVIVCSKQEMPNFFLVDFTMALLQRLILCCILKMLSSCINSAPNSSRRKMSERSAQ